MQTHATKNPAATERGRVQFDFNHMFCGGKAITAEEFAAAKAAAAPLHAQMEAKRGAMAWRTLPYNQAEVVEKISAAGNYIRGHFENFVVLGIGGSALGSKALFSACCHAHYNELPAERRGGPRFYVEDNVDPDQMQALFDVIDVKKTAFHIISKSGETVETMSQFIIILEMLQRYLGDDYRDHLYLTTDKEKGILKKIAREYGFDSFTVPDGVGGRFSVLCPVGLLSAAVLGIDIDALLMGARDMDAACTVDSLDQNPAYLYALLYTIAMKKGVNISVLMPYAGALSPLAEWYAQLWAESLGKRQDIHGNTVRCGQTPVRAMGVTDQHSQVQLYNEGPFDKIITFLGVNEFHTTLPIPASPIDVMDAAYLSGQTLNKLINAERQATIHAVTEAGQLNNTILVDSVNAYTLGKLFCFFEMATAAAGELLEINAFDQPGVEAGKVATFALMGREGYEEEAARLLSGGDTCPALQLEV